MGHFSPSPHGRIKDLPGYSYDDVDYGTMLDLAKGRRFQGARSTSERGYGPSYDNKKAYRVEMSEIEKVAESMGEEGKVWIEKLRKMLHAGGGKVQVVEEKGEDAVISMSHPLGHNLGTMKVPMRALRKAGNIPPIQMVQPWTDAYGNPVNPKEIKVPIQRPVEYGAPVISEQTQESLRRRPDYGEIEMEIEKRLNKISSIIVSPYLSKEEVALPEGVHQSISTQAELFKQAEEADTQMRVWLEGISKKLALRHYHQVEYGYPKIDFEDEGMILITTPVKKVERAIEKVNGDYGGDWSLLLDMVRATIAVDRVEEVFGVMDILRGSGMVLARRPKDKFTNPDRFGFRNIHMNVRLPNGHIGELQINLKSVLKVREEMHRYYELVRGLEAEAEKSGKDLTVEEKVVIGDIIELLLKRYNEAWIQAGGVKVAAERMPRNLGDINRELKKYGVRLIHGRGYYYPISENRDGADTWTGDGIYVFDCRAMSIEWWVKEVLEQKEKYMRRASEGEGKSKVFLPPSKVENPNNFMSVFLAGSIDMGEAEDWQTEISKALKDTSCVVMNPRREDWDSSWKQDIKNDKFREQVEWELEGMENATLIAMCLTKDSKAPISLLELGLHASDGKMIVCCPKGFWRKGNVDIVCKRYDVPVFEDFDEFKAEVVKRIQGSNVMKAGSRGHMMASDRVTRRMVAREFVVGMRYYDVPHLEIPQFPVSVDACPVCGKRYTSQCRCSGPHSLEDLEKGHGRTCPNGHRWSGSLVYDSNVEAAADNGRYEEMNVMDKIMAMDDNVLVPRDMVAQICGACAEKMDRQNLSALRASVIKAAYNEFQAKDSVKAAVKDMRGESQVPQLELTKVPNQEKQAAIADKIAYGYHKTYGGDPYWLTLKYPAHCDKCHKPLGKGERAFYYPRGKSFFGESCGHGEEAEKDFHNQVEMEEGHLI